MTIIDELANDIQNGQNIFRAQRVKKFLFHAVELQDKLTMAINVNIEMQRQIREMRAEQDALQTQLEAEYERVRILRGDLVSSGQKLWKKTQENQRLTAELVTMTEKWSAADSSWHDVIQINHALSARVEELEAASYAFLEYVDYSPDPEDDSEEAGDSMSALWIDAERKARAVLEVE